MRGDAVEIRRLGPVEARAALDELAAVLFDCVDAGASVSFMAPFGLADAVEWFASLLPEIEEGRRILLAAYEGGTLVGTVQIVHVAPPNQAHRADIAKLLVHRRARGRGIAALLMERAEAEALAEGKWLLVLDTVTGSTAERLYRRLGWTTVGVIPDYARYPDGRLCSTTVFWKRLTPA